MSRPGWLLATLAMMLLSGTVLSQAGRLGLARPLHASPRRVELRGSARAEALASDSAHRWRHAEPTHWRACVLQR